MISLRNAGELFFMTTTLYFISFVSRGGVIATTQTCGWGEYGGQPDPLKMQLKSDQNQFQKCLDLYNTMAAPECSNRFL